jgi:hypothetical protein
LSRLAGAAGVGALEFAARADVNKPDAIAIMRSLEVFGKALCNKVFISLITMFCCNSSLTIIGLCALHTGNIFQPMTV